MKRYSVGQVMLVVAGGLAAATARTGYAEVKVVGFSDVGYEADSVKTTGNSTPVKDNYFAIDDIDVFLQSNLGDDFSWLSESTFSAGADNFTGFDVERVLINYRPKDYFNIGAGRFHTALGYWNDTFHHGTWLATSIARPSIYTFEDGGGILPIHSVGIEIRGVVAQKFGYIFNLANGRGPTPNPVQIVNDANGSKAVNLLLYWLTPLEGLRVGAGYYLDTIPTLSSQPPNVNAETQTAEGYQPHNGAKEDIADAHIVYKAHNAEFINEYHRITHAYDSSHVVKAMDNVTTVVTSVYSQLGYNIKDVYTPYARYEMINGDKSNDEVYMSDLQGNPMGKGLKHQVNTVGVRWDVSDVVALKFEMAQDKLSNFYSASGNTAAAPTYNDGVTITTTSGRANVSFAF